MEKAKKEGEVYGPGLLMHAKAICETCGTIYEHPGTGYCINDHDNWIEQYETERIIKVAKKFKVSPEKVLNAINDAVELNVLK